MEKLKTGVNPTIDQAEQIANEAVKIMNDYKHLTIIEAVEKAKEICGEAK